MSFYDEDRKIPWPDAPKEPICRDAVGSTTPCPFAHVCGEDTQAYRVAKQSQGAECPNHVILTRLESKHGAIAKGLMEKGTDKVQP